MSSTSFAQLLISAQGAGPLLANSTVATSVLPTQAKYTYQPYLTPLEIGSMLRFTVCAQVSNIAGASSGTITFDIRFGSVVVFNGGACNLSTTAHTTLPVWYEILLTCQAVGGGTSANFLGQGIGVGLPFNRTATADGAANFSTVMFPSTTPAAGTGFDSSASSVIDHFVTFSVNTNPTNYTLQQYALELVN